MKDAVVEEIRERRRRLLQQKYDGSISKFVEEARAWQHRHPTRVVRLRKSRVLVTPNK